MQYPGRIPWIAQTGDGIVFGCRQAEVLCITQRDCFFCFYYRSSLAFSAAGGKKGKQEDE
ncbi:hypothetical protein NXW48_06535 [Phocaeicola vulgatus]|nr:hypothetical protein [Phocaeicola vulgatus]